jgi:hypothetical protein
MLTNEDEVEFPGQCFESLWGYLRPEGRHLYMRCQLREHKDFGQTYKPISDASCKSVPLSSDLHRHHF